MNFWEKITLSDLTKEMKSFESRAAKLLKPIIRRLGNKSMPIFGRTPTSPAAI